MPTDDLAAAAVRPRPATRLDAPYVGPRPFTRGDAKFFFGRDREAHELLSLIIAHPLVVLYAQSGAGKSSLINAGVIPLLEASGAEVMGPVRVRGPLPEGVDESEVSNIFMFNSLFSLRPDIKPAASLRATTLNELLGATPDSKVGLSANSPRVLLFDQLEEVFTTYPARWSDRSGFFGQITEAVKENFRLRVVFSMREEYIARLEPHAAVLPERLRTRFRLERLGREGALLAVKKPLEVTATRAFSEQAAQKLVDNLLRVPVRTDEGVAEIEGEFVEPVQLQVVCSRLWGLLDENVQLIDASYIESHGDVNEALTSYYEAAVQGAAAAHSLKEGQLRHWFERALITPDGTRGIAYREGKATAGLPNAAVDDLENLHLIRAEVRGGAPWYELAHDRFIDPIRKSNYLWRRARSRGDATVMELESKATAWVASARKEELLLSEEELAAATRWLASPDAEEMGVSPTVREFVQASQVLVERTRADKQRRINSKLQWQRVALVLLVAVAVTFAVLTAMASREAANAASAEKGAIAKVLAGISGVEFEALALGINAVFPSVQRRVAAPVDAREGLRAAVQNVGESIWLRFPSPILGGSFSADGKRVMAYSRDLIEVRDAGSGKSMFRQPKPNESSSWYTALMSQDGMRLYAVQRPDETLPLRANPVAASARQGRWWNIDGGDSAEAHHFDVPTGSITFSSDGRLLVENSGEAIRLVDVEQSKTILEIPGREFASMRLSPDKRRLVAVSQEELMYIWDVASQRQISGGVHPFGKAPEHKERPYSISFTEDSSAFSVYRFSPELAWFSSETGSRLASVEPAVEYFQSSWLPGRRLLVLYTDFSQKTPQARTIEVFEESGALAFKRQAPSEGSILVSGDKVIEKRQLKDSVAIRFLDPASLLPAGSEITLAGGRGRFGYASGFSRVYTSGNEKAWRVWDLARSADSKELGSAKERRLLELACLRMRYQPEEKKTQEACSAVR